MGAMVVKLVFIWHEEKALSNYRKHKVGFEEAKTVFGDSLLLTLPDELHSDEEERFLSIGRSVRGRTLLVVHTEQMENHDSLVIRIISCRKATSKERNVYEGKGRGA